ncbi:MAG: DUF3791 domain-containing protein [Eggerthellaceae bacterium]|nr:DUF3791 domain-containing protein [Eggerthellaceae bacterium]
MSADYGKIADYMIMIVSEYASDKGITDLEAFWKLDACGGIEALEENYEIEHTLPISSTIEALDALCARKGDAA